MTLGKENEVGLILQSSRVHTGALYAKTYIKQFLVKITEAKYRSVKADNPVSPLLDKHSVVSLDPRHG